MADHRLSPGVGEGWLRSTPRSDSPQALCETISALANLDANELCLQWRNHLGGSPPAHLPRWLLLRVSAYRVQAAVLGGLDKEALRILRQPKGQRLKCADAHPFETRTPTTRAGASLRAGALLVREWNGKLERVMVLEKGFAWNGETFGSLSQIAKAMTGTSWNGHRFFGLRTADSNRSVTLSRRGEVCDGAPLGSYGKVRRDGGSLGLARAATGEMPLAYTTKRRESRKAASS
jgi:hypothetical protein